MKDAERVKKMAEDALAEIAAGNLDDETFEAFYERVVNVANKALWEVRNG